MSHISTFLRRESGAAAAEYSLLLAFVSIAIIFALENLGNGISSTVNIVSGALSAS